MSIKRSEKLGLLCTGVIGSYGGGDNNRVASQLFMKTLDTSPGLLSRFELWLTGEISKTHNAYKIHNVVRIPQSIPDHFEWSFRFQVSTTIPSMQDRNYNMMFQGWLFEDDVESEGCLGFSRYPLIGLHEPLNFKVDDESNIATIGLNSLKPADQHVHLVSEELELDGFIVPLEDWHFGSDMSRFFLESNAKFAKCWVFCVDLDKKKIEAIYLFVAYPELEKLLSNNIKIVDEKEKISKILETLAHASIPEPVVDEIRSLLIPPRVFEMRDLDPSRNVLTQAEALKRSLSLIPQVTYHVELFLTKSAKDYRGKVTINFSFKSLEDIKNGIFIDFAGKAISKFLLNQVSVITDITWSSNRIFLDGALLQKENKLEIEYTNDYNHSGEGFHQFIDPQDNEEYLYTNFCPFEAHRLFPAFDQPDIKGIFSLIVTAPSDWNVIANSPVLKVQENVKTKTHTFDDTPLISTYVFAVIAGPFAHIESTYESTRQEGRQIPLGIYCRKSKLHFIRNGQDTQIFDLTKAGLSFFQDFFDYDFPFKKYDQIFCPEFNWGAMENIGAVIFSESHILAGVLTESQLSARANTLLHEMAHMWFGNLVTPSWWDGLWLNESFATYLGTFAVSQCTPFRTTTWMHFNKRSKQSAYKEDQRITTHPIQPTVLDTEQTFLNFDGITYGKGASVLKQLVSFLGIKNFQKGMIHYFKTYQWKNTNLRQFLEAVSYSAKESNPDFKVEEWAQQWFTTCGKMIDLKVIQSAIPEHPTLRNHHSQVAVFTEDPETKEMKLHGPFEISILPQEETKIDEKIFESFTGNPVFVYPNFDDQGFFNTILDSNSLNYCLTNIDKFENPLLRLLVWQDLFNMTSFAKMKSRDFLELARKGIKVESDLAILQAILDSTIACLSFFVPSASVIKEADLCFDAILDTIMNLSTIEPLPCLKPPLLSSAFSEANIKRLETMLDNPPVLEKIGPLAILPWQIPERCTIISKCVAKGFEGSLQRLDKQYKSDPTERGKRFFAAAMASLPDPNTKEKLWNNLLDPNYEPSHVIQVTEMGGFRRGGSHEIMKKYEDKYFEDIFKVFEKKPKKTAIQWAVLLFPFDPENDEIAVKTKKLLENELLHDPVMRRILLERVDDLEKAKKARLFYS